MPAKTLEHQRPTKAQRVLKTRRDEAFARRTNARSARYDLRDALRSITSKKRLAGCGRWVMPNAAGVEVRVAGTGKNARASYGNLQHCGSVWSCPVCSPKIRQQRAEEVAGGADRWMKDGHGLTFVTLTMPHTRHDDLQGLLDTVLAGWTELLKGRAWASKSKTSPGLKARLGIVGYLRGVEVTHGRNGWHPHIHAVIATEKPLSDDELADLGDSLHSRWARFVVGQGYKAPSRARGVDCQRVRNARDVGEYLVKVQDSAGRDRGLGLELLRGDLKKGRNASRTPFEILEAAGAGDPVDRKLWAEYETATWGRRCLTWSKGLRRLWQLAVAEVTDEDLANADEAGPDAVVVAVLTDAAWSLVLATPGGRAGLLTAAEVDGDIGVNRCLERWAERMARLERRRGPARKG